LDLPASPLDVARCRTILGVFRAPLARSIPERTARCEPPRLMLHFGAVPIIPADSTALLPVHPHLPTPKCRRGVPRAPPSTCRCSVHSRERPESHSHRLRSSTFEVTFRPRGFAPPRRLPPLLRSRACCIPLPILGFIVFRARVAGDQAGRPRDVPTMQDLPSKKSPRQPFRVTAVVAPVPFARDHRFDAHNAVASGEWIESGGSRASASRPCSVFGSGVCRRRCRRSETRSFLGFVPLQGPFVQPEIHLPLHRRESESSPKGRFATRQLRFAPGSFHGRSHGPGFERTNTEVFGSFRRRPRSKSRSLAPRGARSEEHEPVW
jgi:hypothetical protein